MHTSLTMFKLPTLKWYIGCRAYSTLHVTRRQKILNQNYAALSSIAQIDKRFSVFHSKVTKVVDLGYVPGNWLQYASERLQKIHGLDEDQILSKCTLLGLDLLCGGPIPGTITTQGNIFSQAVHNNVVGLLQEAAFRHMRAGVVRDPAESYISKEGEETSLENEVSGLGRAFAGESGDREKLRSLIGRQAYQADVVMLDLGVPYLQNSGFYNNTYGRPYIRSGTSEVLRGKDSRASIDMAEAALILSFDALVKGGTFVVRLARVPHGDPELRLLCHRMDKVFEHVEPWQPAQHADMFVVGRGKRAWVVDRREVFQV